MNTVLDTRTHGQLRHAERHIEPAPRRRWNRDFRAVRRADAIAWIEVALFFIGCYAAGIFYHSGAVQAFLEALRNQP